ncbi:hypothetical protein PAXRUDRAFT_829337 [Paxillus rubicundulus Ve08.2h10]|uniref:Borealin N-terminal domain-containing protein n=1 Tax=Paxillus rubicundulus Ve08.2h10 TaxID=930991 RepID=A0A0D0D822_9AGAM|nr:hypothetical protein PAXRUDRAFT_829337 [Paxillus rubicundulus Ve08.2h10]
MKVPDTTRNYTPEEKQQLIKNLDIEVEHRVRQLEEWLAVALQNFRLHQEGLISRIPKLVRGVSMGEFADKYNGDIQACLRGLQSARMGMGGAETFEIDRDTRKRKWAAAQEEAEASGSRPGKGHGQRQEVDQGRAAKNARIMATPKKNVAGPSTHPTPRAFSVVRTPGAVRTTMARPPIPHPSPSPHKLHKPPSFVPVRTASPSKHPNAHANHRTHPPSSATFNPTMLPPKAPTYPTLRPPRRDESMLSVNGSPLANPYTLGLGWFAGEDDDGKEGDGIGRTEKGKEGHGDAPKTLRRVDSIVIRRDLSITLPPSKYSQPNGTISRTHSRANSQTQILHSAAHSRTNSRTQLLSPLDSATPSTNATPLPLSSVPSGSASALVSIPIKDGHLLEFDPLTTSPRALDKLVGITESAKKQAREEMARLVKEAVRKWVIE